MARAPKGWERLRPSRGQNGAPGRRLLSQDEEVQVQMWRQKTGAHAGWTWLMEWSADRGQWEFLLRDERSNVVAQAFGEIVQEAADAANEIVTRKGYPPLPL